MLRMRNVHSFTPTNIRERITLCLSYFGIFPVLLVILLGFGVHMTYFVLLSMRYTNQWTLVLPIIFLVIGGFMLVLQLIVLFRTVFTCAGYVPRDPWEHPPQYIGSSSSYVRPENEEASANRNSVRQLDRNYKLRYCTACEQFKPDRAYHCTTCERCTLNFDHHCPVLNNCIGRDNYKMFILLLNYSLVSGIYVSLSMFIGIFFLDDSKATVGYMVFACCCLIISVCMGSFGCVHIYWLCIGHSTASKHASGFSNEKCLGNEDAAYMRAQHCEAVCGVKRTCWRLLTPVAPVRNDFTASA
uniref:Palmitoyltransferase n=1 Tax=Trypanosoma congolense (strain IL3000) TaxID=1068625 RepID=F9WAU1_TRYCI|nr:unnamed protein product [Trypanosoma congolense IL3000]